MPKYENHREQADADFARIQEELGRLDDLRSDADERAEQLEREMDVAHEAGDAAESDRLAAEHQRAEQESRDHATDFESAMSELSQTTKFWGLG